METGNPKQVAVLGVVAIAAIGFLFSRLGGKSLPGSAVAAAERKASVTTAGTAMDSPLLIDPFSHPKLAPPKPRPVQPTDTSLPASLLAGTISGPLPIVGEVPSEHSEKSPSKEETTSNPKTDTPVQPEPVEVTLEATAGASDNVAFISVAGADSQPFRPNDLVMGKIRLVRINDGAIVLSGPKGELTIEVGERKRI